MSDKRRRVPEVVTFVDPTAKPAAAGTKRGRDDRDPEAAAFLSGHSSAVLAASLGKIAPKPERRPRKVVDDAKKIQVKFEDIFKDVQSLGAKTFTGKEKKAYEMKQLNALGAGLKFKEVMPLRMYLGVKDARLRREKAAERERRESGLVTGSPLAKKKARKVFSTGPADQPADITPDNVRGSVMYVRK